MTQAFVTLCGSLSLHPSPLGAAMHSAGYRALGINFSYVPFAIRDLAGALVGMRALGIRGLGISMPFKQAILPLLDDIDPLAARIGAVNTVVNQDGKLSGYNTDAAGAARALAEALPIAGKRIVILGAGGAARAVAYALHAAGAALHIANRDAGKAEALAKSLAQHGAAGQVSSDAPVATPATPSAPQVTAGPLDALASLSGYDVLVNCTSLGMHEYGAAPPLDVRLLRSETLVMDIVYKPVVTELLLAARRVGAPTIHGGRMLLHQACRQFELYTGLPAPLEAMDSAQRAQLGVD